MCTVTNLIEDTLVIKFSTDYLLLPFLILLISKAKFIIGHFADNHINKISVLNFIIKMKTLPILVKLFLIVNKNAKSNAFIDIQN